MLEPTPWQALGAHLSAARHRTSFTQHHIAHQIGVTQAAYSQIERGHSRPRPAHLGRLAVTLSADIALLASLADYPLARVLTDLAAGRLTLPRSPRRRHRPPVL